MDFNPPTPCGVGQPLYAFMMLSMSISIHPPRAGWDFMLKDQFIECEDFNPPTPCGVGRDIRKLLKLPKRFQSTHPVRGGTGYSFDFCKNSLFQSTHPVRGGTAFYLHFSAPHGNFNPPTPCGVGRRKVNQQCIRIKFQSTHPVRGGTNRIKAPPPESTFQSTHPVRGGTANGCSASKYPKFQSTHPVRGGTPICPERFPHRFEFQSTHPVRGGTMNILL